MATYRVLLTQSANVVLDVEAESPAAAKQAAEEQAYAQLCNQCSREVDLDSVGWNAIDDEPELVR